MKWNQVLYYLFNRLTNRFIPTLFSIMTAMLVFGLVIFVAVFSHSMENGYRELNRIFPGGTDKTVVFVPNMNILSEDDQINMLKEIAGCDLIAGIGSYSESAQTYINGESDLSNLIICNTCSFDVCGLSQKLMEGTAPVQLSPEERMNAIYLGYNHRDIPIGTRLTWGIGNEQYEVTVQGILKKNVRLYDESLLYTQSPMEFRYTYEVDDSYIALMDGVPAVRMLISFKEDASKEEGTKQVQDILAKYSQSEYCISDLNSILKEKKEYDDAMKDRLMPMLLLTAIGVVIVYMSLQLMNMITSENEFGIWMANGVSRWDIFRILFWENMSKLLMAAIGDVLIVGLLIYGELCYADVQKVILIYGIRECMLIIVLISFVTTVTAVLLIQRKSMSQLVKGNW